MSSFNFFGKTGGDSLEEAFSNIRSFFKKDGLIIKKNNFNKIERPAISKNQNINDFLEEISGDEEYSANWQPIHYFEDGEITLTEQVQVGVKVINHSPTTLKNGDFFVLDYFRRINDSSELDVYRNEFKTKKEAMKSAKEAALNDGFEVKITTKSNRNNVIISVLPKFKTVKRKVKSYCFFGWDKI